ncbi:MAG: hypothetical protein K2O46_01515, partial [Bacteroidales bacterium]|nr:hypothetical protein [Bacteroidales bacterium]
YIVLCIYEPLLKTVRVCKIFQESMMRAVQKTGKSSGKNGRVRFKKSGKDHRRAIVRIQVRFH